MVMATPKAPQPSPLDQGGSTPAPALTTFVQADPTTFRALVQKLTGAGDSSSSSSSTTFSSPKLPLSAPSRHHKPLSSSSSKTPFKLHERRHNMRKLHIPHHHLFKTTPNDFFLVSPVSPLDQLFPPKPPSPSLSAASSSLSPSPSSRLEEEERAIAEKGFFLHPSPLKTPRSADPELLPLFPLHSPREDQSSASS